MTWLHRILTSYILLLFAVKSIAYVVSLRCAGLLFLQRTVSYENEFICYWLTVLQRLHTASSALWDVASLLALQPHAWLLQLLTSRQTCPMEVFCAAASVHSTPETTLVPESAAEVRCAVSCLVVITVVRGEHLTDSRIVSIKVE